MTEENLGLLFGLMRQSLNAAAEGKPAPELSADEKARIEASSQGAAARSLEAAVRMLDRSRRKCARSIRSEGLGK